MPATVPQNAKSNRRSVTAALVMLTLVAVLAFANAWPDRLVLDDRAFAGNASELNLQPLSEAFSRDIWEHRNKKSGLYRPLLLINFELETRLFGDWYVGYHLVNIFLHVCCTLLLFGFLRIVLAQSSSHRLRLDLVALLAALVFAVHPVHTEVVNSVFNRSSMFVSLLAMGGLWWLLSQIKLRPALAWSGLGLSYFLAMLFKESATVIPGIAAALVLLLTPGSLGARIRKSLPVFWLLIPLGLYLVLRANALADTPAISELTSPAAGLTAMAERIRPPDLQTFLGVSAVIGQALKVIVWPYPLHLYYDQPSGTMQLVYLALNVVAIATSVLLCLRGRLGMALGMSFFYLAILPASRLIGSGDSLPHLAERYLYYPSIGLTITLAFALRYLVERFSPGLAIATTLPLIVILTALSWERNADWGSEILLFETEYERWNDNPHALRLLVAAHFEEGHFDRVRAICRAETPSQQQHARFANTCALAFVKSRELEQAVQSFEWAAEDQQIRPEAYRNLTQIHAALGQPRAAAKYYAKLVELTDDPALEAYLKGEMFSRLGGNNVEQLETAVLYLQQALQLKPDFPRAQELLDQTIARLESLAEPDDAFEDS
jgi:tetratricopeptide (TPR) repeat protein